MTNTKIWLSSPHMGPQELEYMVDAFNSNWIAPLGPYVDGFETDLANYNKVSEVAALSSGTAAIHLALILLGVKWGDEVICQSFTFSASANPIVYQGATPVFVDSEPETWNISPFYLRKAIEERIKNGKKPKAIIVVHLYGMPANMNEILNISREFDIPVIEDAAEALGSKYFDQPCSTFGDYGILSFNGNKIITTSGGGALLCKDITKISKARFLATQARDSADHYEHSHIGFNYRMSNICAAIGRGQMKVLDQRVEARRSNFQFYKENLKEYTGIKFLEELEGSYSNRWLTTILVEPKELNGISRKNLYDQFKLENIETRPLWKPMHLQPVFSEAHYYGEDIAEKLFENGLCLPSGSNLQEQDLNRVLSCFKSYLN